MERGVFWLPVTSRCEEQHKLSAPNKQDFAVNIAETSLSKFFLPGTEAYEVVTDRPVENVEV